MQQNIRNSISHFLNSSRQLFWFFFLINLIPTIFLLFTEPLSPIGKIILFMFPAGIYLILYSLLKNIGLMQLFLIPKLILDAFQLVLFYLFGESVLAADMFLNLATTNVTEASELLNSLRPAIIAVCVVYIPTIIIAAVACKRKIHLTKIFRRTTSVSGLTIVLVCSLLTSQAKNTDTGIFKVKYDVYPVNALYNLKFAINKWQKSELYPLTSKDFRFNASKTVNADTREIYMLVIGEASRANNWSLYGYDRETNPKLKEIQDIAIYKDAITQVNATHKSVPLILSATTAENFEVIYHQKSIVEAFKEAGFTTIFLSNQTPNRTFTDYFSEEADYRQNIRPASTGGLYTVNNYDEQMLPLCQYYINSLPGNLFFVIHTYGSHFNYNERYPREFAYFTPDNVTEIEVKNKQQLINAYDNSIRYTDHFLYSLINLLEKTNACTALYFTPDHGEDLLDDDRERFLHASPHPTYYQLHIPIFIWFSQNYVNNFPKQFETAMQNQPEPISTNTAFHTVLDMASIQTPYLNRQYSLVSPDFKAGQRMYLTDHDLPIPYYKSGLKKQDKAMIRKKGMVH